MLSRNRSRRRGITFLVLVGLSLVMLAVSGSAPVQQLRRGVTFAVAPVQGTLSDGTRSVTQIMGAFGEIDLLRIERQELQAEVDRLQDQVATLESIREDNKRLKRQLKTKDRLEYQTAVGQVTSRPSSQFERIVTLDIGEEVGVVIDAPVLSDGGALVGIVTDVSEGWSSVQLISDTRSLVIGLDNRTRATGEVTGRLSSPLAMSNIKVTDKIDVNDLVVSAGLEVNKRFRSLYPKGLPIGKVVDVQKDPGSIVQTALIEPLADLDGIEDVLVITDFRPARRRPKEEAE
jgi:rod shape-determining protein MreC